MLDQNYWKHNIIGPSDNQMSYSGNGRHWLTSGASTGWQSDPTRRSVLEQDTPGVPGQHLLHGSSLEWAFWIKAQYKCSHLNASAALHKLTRHGMFSTSCP